MASSSTNPNNHYMSDSFWIYNKYWEKGNYSKESIKRLNEGFYKEILERYKSKGHKV